MLTNLNSRLSNTPQWLVLTMAALVIGLIAYLDKITDRYISVEFLYFGPVIFATWYAGPVAGYFCGMIATVAVIVADIYMRYYNLHLAFVLWNGGLKRLTFLLVAFLVTKNKNLLNFEKS